MLFKSGVPWHSGDPPRFRIGPVASQKKIRNLASIFIFFGPGRTAILRNG